MKRRFPGTFAALSALFLAVLFLAFGGEGNKAYAQTMAGSLGAPEALSARAIATSTPAAIEFSAAGSDGALTSMALGNRQPVVGGFNGTNDANAVQIAGPAPACPLKVLIVYSDIAGAPTALQSEVLAEPGVTAADLFDARTGTPTLAQLQAYDIVAPMSNNAYLDSATLGNNLADYVDAGGIVVQLGFSFYGGESYGVDGRWVSGNYNPYNYSTNLVGGTAFTLGTFNAGHPLMAGVTTLNSNYQNVVTLAGGATEVAAASNGNSLVAYRPVSGGHTTVGITAYVGFFATQSGHWGRVVVNAGRWLSAQCQPGAVLSSLSPAKLWVGLKNSDDQGTQFDIKVEILKNGTPVASGLQRCMAGLTRNPNLAKESNTAFDAFAPVTFGSGDVLSLRVSTRIGTNPDGTKCSGHNNAQGLRLYYDAASRASHFDATISPNPNEDLYLHSDGSTCPNGDGDSPGVTTRFLNDSAPGAANPRCKNSGSVNFAGGNPFSLVGTWSLPAFP